MTVRCKWATTMTSRLSPKKARLTSKTPLGQTGRASTSALLRESWFPLQNLKLSKALTKASVPTRQATAANAVFVTPGIERDSIFLVPWLGEFPNGVRPANAREMDALLKLAFLDHPHFHNVNGIFCVGSKDSLFERLTVLAHPDRRMPALPTTCGHTSTDRLLPSSSR